MMMKLFSGNRLQNWGAHYTWVAMVLQGVRVRSESEGWGEGW